MSIDSYSKALDAYNKASSMMGDVQPQANIVANPSGSFSAFLSDVISSSKEVIGKGEEMSAKALLKQANINDVVLAVNKAELTLQTVTAIRDRVIAAYQEISKMPI